MCTERRKIGSSEMFFTANAAEGNVLGCIMKEPWKQNTALEEVESYHPQVRESSVLDSYHRKRAASSLVADCTNPQRPPALSLGRES